MSGHGFDADFATQVAEARERDKDYNEMQQRIDKAEADLMVARAEVERRTELFGRCMTELRSACKITSPYPKDAPIWADILGCVEKNRVENEKLRVSLSALVNCSMSP